LNSNIHSKYWNNLCHTQHSAKRAFQESPDRSPHKVGKDGPKKQRTVAVRNLTSTLLKESTITPSTLASLKITDFKENQGEVDEQNSLKAKLFSYIVLKYVVHHSTEFKGTILSEMRCPLDDNKNAEIQPSKIHYMELINEHPDNGETMCLVAEDLLEKFDTEEQQGWVVLVGDGKTYQHLMNIKQQYGTALEKLIIFPGDWHTLRITSPS